MRDLLDIIEANLRGFPYVRAELVDFLSEGLEVWLLLVEQRLKGFWGNTIAALGDCVGHPVVELCAFEAATFNGHSVLPEARRALFRITDTTAANQGCAARGMLQVALQLGPIGFAELVQPMADDDTVCRHQGQCAGNAERIFQGIIIHAEYITIEVAWSTTENMCNQGGRVLLDEIRLLTVEEIAGINLPLRQPFPQRCSRYTRHSVVL
jgi:hypothetical protein